MLNKNPLKTTDDGVFTVFTIPKKFAGKKITISATTSISQQKWGLDLLHTMRLSGILVKFDPTPDIEQAELATGKKLDGKKFALITIATRVRNGGPTKVPKTKYAIKFEAGDELIDDEFTMTSDETNPETFYTKITFKLEK